MIVGALIVLKEGGVGMESVQGVSPVVHKYALVQRINYLFSINKIVYQVYSYHYLIVIHTEIVGSFKR